MKNFRSLQLASIFYKQAKKCHLKGDIRSQLLRASASICLNLAEGRGRKTKADQLRFFQIAMGSIRESQTVLIIEDMEETEMWGQLDRTAAAVYQLIKNAR